MFHEIRHRVEKGDTLNPHGGKIAAYVTCQRYSWKRVVTNDQPEEMLRSESMAAGNKGSTQQQSFCSCVDSHSLVINNRVKKFKSQLSQAQKPFKFWLH